MNVNTRLFPLLSLSLSISLSPIVLFMILSRVNLTATTPAAISAIVWLVNVVLDAKVVGGAGERETWRDMWKVLSPSLSRFSSTNLAIFNVSIKLKDARPGCQLRSARKNGPARHSEFISDAFVR